LLFACLHIHVCTVIVALIVYRCSAGGDVIEALGIQHKLKPMQMNHESSTDVMLVVYCALMRYQSAELSSA
jgi:hypothetical protein